MMKKITLALALMSCAIGMNNFESKEKLTHKKGLTLSKNLTSSPHSNPSSLSKKRKFLTVTLDPKNDLLYKSKNTQEGLLSLHTNDNEEYLQDHIVTVTPPSKVGRFEIVTESQIKENGTLKKDQITESQFWENSPVEKLIRDINNSSSFKKPSKIVQMMPIMRSPNNPPDKYLSLHKLEPKNKPTINRKNSFERVESQEGGDLKNPHESGSSINDLDFDQRMKERFKKNREEIIEMLENNELPKEAADELMRLYEIDTKEFSNNEYTLTQEGVKYILDITGKNQENQTIEEIEEIGKELFPEGLQTPKNNTKVNEASTAVTGEKRTSTKISPATPKKLSFTPKTPSKKRESASSNKSRWDSSTRLSSTVKAYLYRTPGKETPQDTFLIKGKEVNLNKTPEQRKK